MALSSDMVFEILSRTSLETLERCKAVSKGCNQMINEATFLPLHCQRSNCIFGYFFEGFLTTTYTLVSDVEHSKVDEGGGGGAATAINGAWRRDMQILASSDQGILCCEKEQSRNCKRYYACKPATNQWRRLPNPKLRYRTAAVAIVVVNSQPLHYNIVRLSYARPTKCEKNYNCEIFDSQNWKWEKGPNFPYVDDLIEPHHPAVTIGPSIHWLTSNDNVLTFDLNKRCFRSFPLHASVHCNDVDALYMYKKLVKYEGCLAFTCLMKKTKTMELWVAERQRPGEWTRKMVVDMEFLEKKLGDPRPQVVEFCNSDVMFVTTKHGAVHYNLRDCSFRRVEVPCDFIYSRRILRFRSDFESVDLKLFKHL